MTPSFPSVSNRAPRALGLDALRTLAIVGMIAAHTSRLMPPDARPGWSRGILLLEPLIPSLFLLMVGVSLAFSFSAATARGVGAGAWYARQARRAVVLWLIATVFYVLELGPRFPDFVTASGILATIAYAILGAGALLIVPGRARVAALLAALALGIAVLLKIDRAGTPVFPLTAGNAPFLPLWLFTLAGVLWGLLRRGGERVGTPLIHALGLAGAAVAVWLLARHGLDPLFTKPFGRSDAARELAAPLFGEGAFGGAKRLGYYNLRPVLGVFCLGVHLALLSLATRLDKAGAVVARGLAPLVAPGRRSLEVYVLHLALLALFVVALGVRPLKTGLAGTCVLAAVIAVAWVWALFRERRRVV